VAWAYDLDWKPLPVFQDYSAYTAELDDLNADALASPDGPDAILRETPALDERFPGWDPPAQQVATLCNFEVTQTTKRWQLLERVPDRCGEPEPIGSVDSSYGKVVDVPDAGPGKVVLVRIHGAEVSGLESIRTLLYKAKTRWATTGSGDRYRLIPGTAADGLLLSGSRRLVGRGSFAQAPQADSLTVTGLSGDLRYDFFSMDVASPAKPAAARPGKEG
jgi:hypothetical protein